MPVYSNLEFSILYSSEDTNAGSVFYSFAVCNRKEEAKRYVPIRLECSRLIDRRNGVDGTKIDLICAVSSQSSDSTFKARNSN